MYQDSVYNVFKVDGSIKIDSNWFKPQWENIRPVDITNYMGTVPGFRPAVQAKMMYNDENLYVVFRVKDRYIRCIAKDHNGPVWEDSCVEFFFSPDTNLPERYFNLEINCGGTPLMHYNLFQEKETRILAVEDIKMAEIAHSLPQLIDPEITEPVTWTIEYRIPFTLLEKYSTVTRPGPGINWRANFYKIAENNSNPHYITWSVVDNLKPDFHLPQFFGLLKFQ
jgi:hypothetical protein